MEEHKARAYYEEELNDITVCSIDEMSHLIMNMNPENEARLVEGCQYMIKEAADFYASKQEVSYMDLVQEGNMGLILAIRETEYFDEELTIKRFEAAIRSSMESFIESETDNAKINEKIRAHLNVLDEICVNFAKENDREATAEEIAEIMKMDVSDVKYLMKIALDALTKESGE